jgi:hypothetical protein
MNKSKLLQTEKCNDLMELISKRAQRRLDEEHNIRFTAHEAIPTIAHSFLFEMFNSITSEAIEQMQPNDRQVVFNFFDLFEVGLREEGEYNIRPFISLGAEAERLVAKHSNVTGSIIKSVSVTKAELENDEVEDKMILNNVLNKAIITYGINIENYRERFGSAITYNNMVTALGSDQPLSIMMFKRWCDILELNSEFTISV